MMISILKYFFLLVAFFSFSIVLQAQTDKVSITIKEAKPDQGKAGRWDYRSYILTAEVQNTTVDTVYLLNFEKRDKNGEASYNVFPQFWSIIGRVDTTHKYLLNGIPPRPIPPPSSNKNYNPLLKFIKKDFFISVAPMESQTFKINTDISNLHFSLEGKQAFVRLHYKPVESYFKDEVWERFRTTEEQKAKNEAQIEKWVEEGLSREEARKWIITTEDVRPIMEMVREKIYMEKIESAWFKAE